MDENSKSLNHLDVLREIGTMGAGRAATALADLLKVKVEISLPQTQLILLENLDKILGDPEKIFFVIETALEGDVGGRVFFLLPPEEAKSMGAALLGKKEEEISLEGTMFQSALKETVNIVVGAYMNALSDITGLSILFEAPSMAMDMVSALLDFIFIQIAQYSEEALFIKTNLKVGDIDSEGLLLFFPDDPSLKKIFKALNV